MTNGMRVDDRREITWEQRIWTIAQLLMVAATMWVGSSVLRLSEAVARIEVKLELGADRLAALEGAAASGMDDRYRGRDARHDWEVQNARDKGQDDRLNAIAAAMQDLRAKHDQLLRSRGQ